MNPEQVNTPRRDLLFTRVFYLMLFGGFGAAWPFLNLFLLDRGLSGTQVGFVGSAAALVALLAAPFWSNASEKWKHPRTMVQILMGLNALGFFLISQQWVFAGAALAVSFRAFVASGVMPITDAVALRLTRQSGRGYGGVRVFGSLGWMIFVLISGFIVENTELRGSLLFAAVITGLSVVALFYVAPVNFTSDVTEQAPAMHPFELGRRILKRPSLLSVTVMLVVIGIANSGVMQFESRFLHDLGATDSQVAVAGMLSSMVELPFMVAADHLLKRGTPFRLLLIALGIYAGIRLMVFSFPGVYTIMLQQAIQGIGFSFYTIALVRFIAEETLPGETRMMLAFFVITVPNLTAILASPVAGAFFDHLGPRGLYLLASIGYGVAWSTLLMARRQKITSAVSEGTP